ncbi:MAG: C4-type zinc ribbon domain-containing protein, partial [Candidatus Fermentibacteria bacterium]
KELESQKAVYESEKEKLEGTKESSRKCIENKEASQKTLAEFKNKLLQMKTNEEYRAMSDQIEFVKKQISDFDIEILERMYEEEQGEKDLVEAKKIWERNSKRAEKRQDILNGQLEVLEENIEKLMEERNEISSGIGKRLLDKYEQLRTAGRGLVVVGLQKGACGGCLTNIPPQTAVEVSQGKTFICPICGRFVVWKDDSSMAGA